MRRSKLYSMTSPSLTTTRLIARRPESARILLLMGINVLEHQMRNALSHG